MGFLSDLGCRCLASSNGPYRFISDDNFRPVLDTGLNRVKLDLQYIMCVSGFSFFQLLTHAEDSIDPAILAPVHFMCHYFLCLLEMLSSLTVPNYRPVDTEVFYLLCADLPSLGSFFGCCDVLGAYLNIGVEHGFGRGDMNKHGGYYNFKFGLIKLHFVEDVIDLIAHEVDCPVAFPVASYKVTLLLHYVIIKLYFS